MIHGPFLSMILFVVVLVFFVIDYGFMNRFDRERDANKGWSWDYTLLTAGMGLTVILQPWLLSFLGWTTDQSWGLVIQILGGAMILSSFILHIWSRRHLRQFYVERVELQEHHLLIRTGPYAYVRHPIITTFFGLAFGVALLSPSLISLAVVIYTIWDFTNAARQEEELLKKALPDYTEYMEKTPRFFPRIKR